MRFSQERRVIPAFIFVVLGTALWLVPTSGIAQDSYQEQVDEMLNTAEIVARSRGYSTTHYRHHGRLNSGEYRNVTLQLDKGVEYMIVGQCDEDCSDIDIWLYDESDNQIDEDTLSDDTPVVIVTPRWTGRFSYTIKMYACSIEPCYYGVGVYGR